MFTRFKNDNSPSNSKSAALPALKSLKKSNDLTGQIISQTPVHPNSTTKSNNLQPSKDGSITSSDDLFKLGVSYQFLSSTIDSNSNDNENPPPPTETQNPTAIDKVPPPPPPSSTPSLLPPSPSPPQPSPPPAESPPLVLDDAVLSQEVPTKYLPVNAQLPNKLTWLDVLSLAQSVLTCEAEPATDQVYVRTVHTAHTVREVYDDEEDPTAAADADADADSHSLWAKCHVAEVENCADCVDHDGEDDDDDEETVRSSFSSFNIRDVNLSLHKEMSRIWSWREKWRGRKGVGLGLGLGEKAF
ncbi:hypothetical protein B0T09DRAFT_400568 [Sordaria sp. MPI-SDFR-AT-0083]|nr:hypothetical protein B0T09DRAFT_400568 [Sordaria sp. MPI-SDFR-AT-0083]